MVKHGLDFSGPGYGLLAGSCLCGNEISCSKKCGEFFE